MATAAAAIIAATRRRLLSHFRVEGATNEEAAIAFEPRRPMERRQFQRMLNAGVFHHTGKGTFWLDEKSADEWSSARRKRGLIIAAIAAGAAALFLS